MYILGTIVGSILSQSRIRIRMSNARLQNSNVKLNFFLRVPNRNRCRRLGETPLAGTNPWLEQNPSWNKPLAGTSSGLEQASMKKQHALTGETFWLEQPPTWKKLWAGIKSLLERAPGWKQPLAGNSLRLDNQFQKP